MAKGLAISLLAFAAVLTLAVLPGDAMPQGGGGGGGGGGWHGGGGGGGWHGGGGGNWHGGGGGNWHGGHGGFHHGCCGPRVIVGVGSWWWPYGYAYPYGYYAGYYPYAYPYAYPYSVADTAPPSYIQRDVQPQAQYWYYCSGSQAYYPYVKECPGGWIQVAPQPSTQ